MTTIPFSGRISKEERDLWLDELGRAMPQLIVKPVDELTDAERKNSALAITVNPDPTELSKLPNLLWVHSLWAGVERMVTEIDNPDLKIVRLIDPEMANHMAEAVLTWTLFLHRDMPTYLAQQARSQWRQHDFTLAADRRVSFLGLGHLGKVSAARLIQNNFKVQGWSRSAKSIEGVTTYFGDQGLSEMLANTDILIVLLPQTQETINLVDGSLLARLPKDASLINFARGPIVNEQALLESLDSNHLAHAILDVFVQEPLPAAHRFWQHPKITVLPHITAATNKKTGCALLAKNIMAFMEKGIIPPAIDRTRGY